MANCKADLNRAGCSCRHTSCGRHGICCDCIRYHRAAGELPGCYFPADVERTDDRSIERFIKEYQKRGRWW